MFGSKKQSRLFSSKSRPKAKPLAPSPAASSPPSSQSKGIPVRGRGIPRNTIAMAVVVIVIIIAAYLFVFSGPSSSALQLSSNKTVQLAMNKSVLLQLANSPYPYALQLVSNSSSAYSFYFSRTPVLTNPIYAFTMTQGQVFNLSSTGSAAADLQVKLVSAANGSATVELIPIPSAFGVKASSVTALSPTSNQTGGFTASAPTTTVPSNSTAKQTSSSTTTVPATTTISAPSAGGSYTDAQVMLAANASDYGQLMSEYSTLYARDQACTSSTYSSAYILKFGSAPTAPNDWNNVSQTTPYAINYSIKYDSGAQYEVIYNAIAKSSLTSGPILDLTVNAQSGAVVSATFQGAFYGASYNDILQAYQTANDVQGDCGAYLP